MTAYFWSPNNLFGRTRKAVAWALGVALPEWDQTGVASLPVGGKALTSLTTAPNGITGTGYTDACSDGANGLCAIALDGTTVHIDQTGKITAGAAPTSDRFTFLTQAGGVVYSVAAGSGALVSCGNGSCFGSNAYTALGSYGTVTSSLTTDGTALYAVEPVGGAIGIYNLSSQAFSKITAPMATPALVAAIPGSLGVVGWSPASLPFAMGGLGVSPLTATVAAISDPADGQVSTLLDASGIGTAWGVANTLTALPGAGALAWNPNGEQILVASTTAGSVYVLNLVSNAFQLGQTLNCPSAGAVAITPAGDSALVCQGNAKTLAVLSDTLNTWSVTGSVALSFAPSAVISGGGTTMYAVGGSTLAVLGQAGASWSVTASLQLSGNLSSIVQDAVTGYLIIAGITSSAGFVVAVDPVAMKVVTQFSWAGTASGLAVIGTRVFVSDAGAGVVYALPSPSAAWLTAYVNPITGGTGLLSALGPLLWSARSGATAQFEVVANFKIAPQRVGIVGVYASGSWTTTNLGVNHLPSTLLWQGNVLYVATVQNDIYQFGASGTQQSASVVPDFAPQTSGISLGISSLAFSNGHLYAATSGDGVLIQVS